MPDAHAEDLLKTISAAWERESRVDIHHFPIRASRRDGRILLEGQVGDIAAKRLAGDIARHLAGGVPVDDQLRVRPAEPRQDGRLRDLVTRSLLEEPVFAHYDIRIRRDLGMETLREGRNSEGEINVVIDDGVVTLNGWAGSLSHRRLAEVLVWWAGCEKLLNYLRVDPPERETADELCDAVRIVLEKDPLVHASQLSVRANAGTVTLEGYVASAEEARLAVLDCWYIPGVYEVENRIQVGR